VVLLAGSAALAAMIAVPVAAMVATGALVGTLFARGGSNADEPLQTQNPLDVKAALKLGLVIGVLLIAVASTGSHRSPPRSRFQTITVSIAQGAGSTFRSSRIIPSSALEVSCTYS
jgi:hypothetical protein